MKRVVLIMFFLLIILLINTGHAYNNTIYVGKDTGKCICDPFCKQISLYSHFTEINDFNIEVLEAKKSKINNNFLCLSCDCSAGIYNIFKIYKKDKEKIDNSWEEIEENNIFEVF